MICKSRVSTTLLTVNDEIILNEKPDFAFSAKNAKKRLTKFRLTK